MKCPYCLENFYVNWGYASFHTRVSFLKENEDLHGIRYCYCPSCKKLIIQIGSIDKKDIDKLENENKSVIPSVGYRYYEWKLVKPKAINRSSLPKEIPLKFAKDYNEACLVLSDSPKASAALSRRCLQNLLIEKAGAKGDNLYQQIQYVLNSKTLPSHLAKGLDAVRNIGNFAAHAIKSKSSGEIVEVEPGEAEWNLDILEELFDFYFVRPALLAKKKEALNKKLSDSGKPPMKGI